MRSKYCFGLAVALLGAATPNVMAQQTDGENGRVASASGYMKVSKVTDRTLVFGTEADGVSLPIIWGMDTAWPSADNMKRGVAFIGKEVLGTARVSFQPNDLVTNKELSSRQKSKLDERLKLVALSGVKDIALNCDHEVLCNTDAYPDANVSYANYNGKPEEWAKMIEAYVLYCQEKGYNVVSVSPFNEPDYTPWKQGPKSEFLAIAKLLKENPLFENIRICGGNTLNCDEALPWYNYMKDYLDEGNTHQLAGGFDAYAKFFETVRQDGKHATADELHNVMEAMVGVEYGMQTGIWWGFDARARGEFCRANNLGERLAYAEDRTHWTAASVYRNNTDEKVQAFVGTSERQANNCSYRFVATDRDVYYDGYGPTREFVVDMPGGTGYQNGQTNAERVVDITWGEDVAPYINGDYLLMNAGSGKVISLKTATPSNGAAVVQKKAENGAAQQVWSVRPVSSRVGGDFSYYSMITVDSMSMDVLNWSLTACNIIAYKTAWGANQQWYLKYAGNGFFNIVSRHSNLCLEVEGASMADNKNIRQGKLTKGSKKQMWRFVPVGVECERVAPAALAGLVAKGQTAAVRLDWTANAEEDVAGYIVVRAEAADSLKEFNTIGRDIAGTAFVDNSAAQGVDYIYKVKAVDKAGNISEASEEVAGATLEAKAMVAQLQFERDLLDCTYNQMDAVASGTLTYTSLHKSGERSVVLSGSSFMQLPYQLANMEEMTICTWINLRSNTAWQRIFDFGNGTDRYMFLTPNAGSDMRFVMKNGGDEEILTVDKPTFYQWVHVAVTLGENAVRLYVNGELAGESTTMTLRPSDIKPVMNYLGRSQFDSDPLIKAYYDDFRVYNYALSAEEVKAVTEDLSNSIDEVENVDGSRVVATEYYTVGGVRLDAPRKGINIVRVRFADGSEKVSKMLEN